MMGELGPNSRSPTPPPPPPLPLDPSPRPPLQYDVLFAESPDRLPEALPTPDQIETSTMILKDLDSRVTARVGCYVVKYGRRVKPVEGEVMRFVRQHAEVAVPQVYAIYSSVDGTGVNTGYIVMEMIPGETLETLWAHMTESERAIIGLQLQHTFSALRKIPHPGFYGGYGKREMQDYLFDTFEANPAINGPFDTEDDLIEAIIAKYLIEGDGPSYKFRAQYYRRVLPMSLRGNDAPVFTHNDFQRKNIIITPEKKAVLIDWAESGWYPTYWEYATAIFSCGAWQDDWHALVGQVLEEFPTQYLWLSHIRLELWG